MDSKRGNAIRPVPAPLGSRPVSRVATMRRLRNRKRSDDAIEVDLSPLIDCVFLLLIFFLVTTMLKKLEKQIPVVLPDYRAALASVAETVITVYALDAEGGVYRAREQARSLQGLAYERIESLEDDLKRLAAEKGVSTEVRIDTDRDVPVQAVIDALDTLSFQGFENVGVRLRHREDEYFELNP